MGDLFRADYRPPSLGQNTAEQLDALTRGLPGLAQAFNQQILPTEQANLSAQQAVAPGQQALNTSLYGTYGPQIAQISSDIAAQQSAADARNLAGSGQDLARAGLAAQQIADPEYYRTRALLGQKSSDLLNSIDINGLSGSERAETERYINQQNQGRGSADVDSNIKTVENASMFGSALQNKRNALGQAITQATNFLPAAKSGVDVFQQVTGRPSYGPSAAAPTSAQPVGAAASNLTSQLFGNIGATQGQTQDIMAARKSGWQNADPVTKVCCFIFLEHYKGLLPWWVRECRDYYYAKEPIVATGYKRMAKVLVPLMKRFTMIRNLVDKFMVAPLTEHGGWMFSLPGFNNRENYRVFWFSIWKLIGRI